jgi:(2Fe-2S) ferredoxin
MDPSQSPYKILILVCTNKREAGEDSCGTRGSSEVYRELARRVEQLQSAASVRVSETGCLGRCATGPNVLVYPEGRLYSAVGLEDIDAILQETFGPTADLTEPLA